MRLDFETNAAEETDFALASSLSAVECSQKLRAGVKAVQEGSRDEARRLLLEVADVDPDNEDVWLRLASVSEYPEELLIFLDNALRANPANERARQWARATEALLSESFAARRASEPDAAGDVSNKEKNARWKQVLSFNSDDQSQTVHTSSAQNQMTERLFKKAVAEAFAADYDAAEDTLDRLLTHDRAPETENALLVKALLSVSFDEKAECWEAILRANPKNEFALAGTNFMRLLKSLTAVSETPETQAAREASFAEAFAAEEEENFFAPSSEREEITEEITDEIDLRSIYADFSAVAAENSNSESLVADETDTYESSVGESDLPGYYAVEEVSSESNLSAATNDYSPRTAETLGTENLFVSDEQNESNFDDGKGIAEEDSPNTVSCPFCCHENEPQTFVCPSCSAVLTLSDLEMLLAHADADCEIVRQAVERMEAEKDLANFGLGELKILGIGQINLKNLRQGFLYLREAARANPNDVVLSSQVNALAIRLSEIEEQASIHSTMPKNKTILVVDDSATVRKLISSKLEKSGHAVLCAVDGMDALEKIEANAPDLILLDITMPRMDGYQVCKMIRTNEKTKDIPVVMISGKDGFFDKVRGRMAGTTGYITKPFGPETLMKMVENYIA